MRKRIARAAEILDRELFLQLNHQPARAALVLGSGRGGTTWLAESIARQCGSRLLFEPFHPRWAPIHSGLRLFLGPDDEDPILEEVVRRVLSGRVRGRKIDQVLAARLPRGRVVKDIHAANLLPWFRIHHPAVPVVFVLRHPIATSQSRLRAGSFFGLAPYLATPAGRRDAEDSPVAAWLPLYDSYRTHTEPLVRLVADWCIENVYPLSSTGDTGVALAFYESVVLNPIPELARLAEFCGSALGSTGQGALTVGEARKPSAMDWFGTAATAQHSGDWMKTLSRWTTDVPKPTTGQCLNVLADFGLDRFYGDDPLPIGDQPSGREKRLPPTTGSA